MYQQWPCGRRWFGRLFLGLSLGMVTVGCGADDTSPVPGLAETGEVPLVETTADPNPGFVWSGAYKAGDLPPLKVGRPSAQSMEDAHRDPAEADGLVCFGAGGGYGCELALDARKTGQPLVSGANFGGPNVLAWVWLDVPEDTAAVRLIDRSGASVWQRPIDGVVILPATFGSDGECACRLDALDRDGETIASVDLPTGSDTNN